MSSGGAAKIRPEQRGIKQKCLGHKATERKFQIFDHDVNKMMVLGNTLINSFSKKLPIVSIAEVY